MNTREDGFTLTEMMLVVALIGILAAVIVPNLSSTIRKAQEARTLGNLAMLRASIALYITDREGQRPVDNLASLRPIYLENIPLKYTPTFHPEGNSVSAGGMTAMGTATGDWFYCNSATDPNWGQVVVNCIHSNLKGNAWSSY